MLPALPPRAAVERRRLDCRPGPKQAGAGAGRARARPRWRRRARARAGTAAAAPLARKGADLLLRADGEEGDRAMGLAEGRRQMCDERRRQKRGEVTPAHADTTTLYTCVRILD